MEILFTEKKIAFQLEIHQKCSENLPELSRIHQRAILKNIIFFEENLDFRTKLVKKENVHLL